MAGGSADARWVEGVFPPRFSFSAAELRPRDAADRDAASGSRLRDDDRRRANTMSVYDLVARRSVEVDWARSIHT